MAIHRLYACTTCVRDLPVAPGEPTRGASFAAALDDALAQAGLGSELHYLRVSCLNGCLSPCNVALRAPRKFNLRFSRLEAADASRVAAVAAAYMASPTGDPDALQMPAALADRLTVRTPPPHLLFGR